MITSYTYSGSYCKPAVTVNDSLGNVLASGTDYTVAYASNKNAGTAKVTITPVATSTLCKGDAVVKTFTIKKASANYNAKSVAKTIYVTAK